MTTPDSAFETLIAAAERGDIAAIRAQVAGGFDLRATDQFGRSVLTVTVCNLQFINEDGPACYRYEVVAALLELGFDPNQLDPDKFGPLTDAMLAMDIAMLLLLLDAGARPNETVGDSIDDTLYQWAKGDYMFEIWQIDGIPEQPTDGDIATEDTWLAWLDRMAIKYNRRRPDHLLLLRERGAKTKQELITQPDQNPHPSNP